MLNSKQRAYLAGIASKTSTVLQIGKEGINDNLIAQVSTYLEAHELIKIKVLENAGADTRTLCDQLVEKLKADPVLLVGSKIILYRKTSRIDIVGFVLPN